MGYNGFEPKYIVCIYATVDSRVPRCARERLLQNFVGVDAKNYGSMSTLAYGCYLDIDNAND